MLHSRGVDLGAKVQNFLTLLKILLILALVLVGLFAGKGDFSNFSLSVTNNDNPTTLKVVGLSLMWIMFAYSGWNASTYIGSEIRNPTRTLPVSLILGTGIVILLYILLNLVYVYAIPPNEMKGVISVGGLAMGNLFGEGAARVSSLLISFALFSSISAYIIIGPRVYYKMAKDGLFFNSFARIHKRLKVPLNSILLQGGIAILFVLTGTFEQILTFMGFSLCIFPILTVFGLIKLRLRKASVVRMPFFPLPQIIFILVSLFILVLAFLERPVESIIALATIALGVPFYVLFKNKAGSRIQKK